MFFWYTRQSGVNIHHFCIIVQDSTYFTPQKPLSKKKKTICFLQSSRDGEASGQHFQLPLWSIEVKNHTVFLWKRRLLLQEFLKAIREILLGNWDMSNYMPYPLWHWWESVVEICVSLPPQSLAGLRLWLMRLNCYIGQVILSLSSAMVIAGSLLILIQTIINSLLWKSKLA